MPSKEPREEPPLALLSSLLKHEEDTLVEFKEYLPRDWDGKRQVSEAACAMANAALNRALPDAFLVLGVTNDRRVIGVMRSPSDRKEIREFLEAHSDPVVEVIDIVEVDVSSVPTDWRADHVQGIVYILRVAAARYFPRRFYPERKATGKYGAILIRDGPRNREATAEETQRLILLGAAQLDADRGKGLTPEVQALRAQVDGLLSGLLKEPALEIRFRDAKLGATKEITVTPTRTVEKIIRMKGPPPAPWTGALSPNIIATLVGLHGGLNGSIFGGKKALPRNAVELHFELSNSGKAPATDVRAFIHFPPGTKLYEAAEFRSFSFHIPNRSFGGAWVDEGESTVQIYVEKLGNDLSEDRFDPVYAVFPEEAGDLDVHVKLLADYMEPMNSVLTVKVRPEIEEVERLVFDERDP